MRGLQIWVPDSQPLKVGNDAVRLRMYDLLLAIHGNYGHIL